MPGTATVGKLYSDNCGFCVNMAEAWDQMETNITGKKTKFKNIVKFHNIEASNLNTGLPMLNETLKGEKVAEPQGFPTLFKHENGRVSYYQGAREVGPMTQWVMGSNKNVTKGRRDKKKKRRRTRARR
jgi:hypothetical protein